MKKVNEVFRQYAMKLTDEDLKFLNSRLSQRIDSDLADAINLVSKDPEMDKILSLAESAIQIFEIMDELQGYLEREHRKRT